MAFFLCGTTSKKCALEREAFFVYVYVIFGFLSTLIEPIFRALWLGSILGAYLHIV